MEWNGISILHSPIPEWTYTKRKTMQGTEIVNPQENEVALKEKNEIYETFAAPFAIKALPFWPLLAL